MDSSLKSSLHVEEIGLEFERVYCERGDPSSTCIVFLNEILKLKFVLFIFFNIYWKVEKGLCFFRIMAMII